MSFSQRSVRFFCTFRKQGTVGDGRLRRADLWCCHLANLTKQRRARFDLLLQFVKT